MQQEKHHTKTSSVKNLAMNNFEVKFP